MPADIPGVPTVGSIMPANPVSPFRSEATRRAEIRYPVPPAACDCHMHVFGPPDRYPGISGHSYAPREAPLSAWRSMADCISLQRVVVVQPSCYGTDNACLVAVLHELGGCARGVAVIAATTPLSALQALHDAGVRGVRLNAKSIGNRDAAGLRRLMLATAEQVAPLGWHVQVYADLAVLAQVTDSIRAAAAPIVLDHMGGASVAEGAEALRPLLGLLSDGCCWVKLSGAFSRIATRVGFLRRYADSPHADPGQSATRGMGLGLAAHRAARRPTPAGRSPDDHFPRS